MYSHTYMHDGNGDIEVLFKSVSTTSCLETGHTHTHRQTYRQTTHTHTQTDRQTETERKRGEEREED
jgi:hypothetical protein